MKAEQCYWFNAVFFAWTECFLETNDGSWNFNVIEMQSFKLKKIRLLGNASHFNGDLSTGVIFMKVILAPCFSYFLFLTHQSSFHAKVRN